MKQIVIPGQIPEVWKAEALYNKAIRYIEKMSDAASESWEHALWSGLALELLARAALANLAPVLLADKAKPSNLIPALGFPPNEPKFSPTSVGIQTVLNRLRILLPEFDTELESFCSSHVGRRNAELHSGELPYDGVHGSNWHGSYYRACSVLLASMGFTLADFIGNDHAIAASKEVEAATDEAAKAVKGELEAFSKVWMAKDEEERDILAKQALLWSTRSVGHRVFCPSCDSVGTVNGDPIGASQQTLKDDEITERQEHLPQWFQCTACGFKITGLSRLQVVGLGDRYIKTQVYSAAEYYAPEDEWPDYDEDNNEP